jgi:hypothetical protein
MPRVLILFAHPALEKSRVNRRLAAAVSGLAGVTLHDLYEAYPHFDVEVRREQRLLLEHDVLVGSGRFRDQVPGREVPRVGCPADPCPIG